MDGADAIPVDQRSGERFEIQLSVMEPKDERQQAIVADAWKALGASVSFWTFTRPRDRELEALQPGGVLASPKAYEIPYNSRLYSGNISTAANRWTGRDRGGGRWQHLESTEHDVVKVTADVDSDGTGLRLGTKKGRNLYAVHGEC